MTLIGLNAVEKYYGGRAVLRGLGMRVNAGAKIGLVGGNGAGKSTVLRILAGTEEVDGGSDPAPGLERRHFAPVHRGRRTHADGSRTRGAARDLLSPGGTRSVRGAAWLARGGGRPAPDAAGAGASGPAAAPLHGARRTRICGRGTWLPQVAGSW